MPRGGKLSYACSQATPHVTRATLKRWALFASLISFRGNALGAAAVHQPHGRGTVHFRRAAVWRVCALSGHRVTLAAPGLKYVTA